MLAADLADNAAARVRDAGAEHDRKGRARLIAATEYTATTDIIGAFLPADVHRQRATDLADTLGEIDQQPDTHPNHDREC